MKKVIIFLTFFCVLTYSYADSPLHGFVETLYSPRMVKDNASHSQPAAREIRLQLEYTLSGEVWEFFVKDDFYFDKALRDEKEGFNMDLRELNLSLFTSDWWEIKAGRQILTWGTGDMIFINDLFPKDWQSFFSGRDEEYLKAPVDAIKFSFFPEFLESIDIAWMPYQQPDRFVRGERLTYFYRFSGNMAGEDSTVQDTRPKKNVSNSEIALRIRKNFGTTETALYFYNGFWPRPLGWDPAEHVFIYPHLTVYGASVRGDVFRGIGNIEIGYYDSRDDRKGDDPNIPNSQFRFLTGYEKEVATDFTIGIQYYLEYMMDNTEYRSTYPLGEYLDDKDRHLFTLRLTKLAMNQNLILSLFTYASPSDQDTYLRPSITYKFSDSLVGTIGGNIFKGRHKHTFFGQLEDNTNCYIRVRYSF